jgi:hypothetical protein
VRWLYGVWPQTASMEVKNKCAYVIMQDICNKFIEVIFFVRCMVSRPNHLLQDLTNMSLINKINFGSNTIHIFLQTSYCSVTDELDSGFLSLRKICMIQIWIREVSST